MPRQYPAAFREELVDRMGVGGPCHFNGESSLV